MKDVKEYEILKQVVAKQLKGTETADLLEYHPVYISLSRLKKKIIIFGIRAYYVPSYFLTVSCQII